MDAKDLITVYTTTDSSEAEIIRNALQAAGIACEIEGENQAALAGIMDIQLKVRAIDADRARSFIKKHER